MKRIAVLLSLLASPASAGSPGVEDTSFVTPDGLRVLVQSIEIDASVQALWPLWTTSEGFSSWAAPFAVINRDAIESSYNPGARTGDPNNIRNRIIASVPERVLAFRIEQAPEGVPFDVARAKEIVWVVQLEPVTAERTRVTVLGGGFRTGADYDSVYKHFRWGNDWTLAKLRERIADGPVDWTAAFKQQGASTRGRGLAESPVQ